MPSSVGRGVCRRLLNDAPIQKRFSPWGQVDHRTVRKQNKENDTYILKAKIKNGRTDDKRVSINPAIQLLDYLTERYGKALNINTDISLADFLLAARTCDDRGTQTMQGAQAGSVGDRYVLTSDGTSSGSVVSMGLVKSLGTSNSVNFTEFEQVYGKFTKKFMKNSYAYAVGDIIYTLEGYYRVTTAGAKSTAPTGTNPTGFTGPLTSVSLFPINSTTGVITNSPVNFSIVSESIGLLRVAILTDFEILSLSKGSLLPFDLITVSS